VEPGREEEDGVGSVSCMGWPDPRGPVGPRVQTAGGRHTGTPNTERRELRKRKEKHAPCTGFTACKYNVNWSINVAYHTTTV